MCFLRSNITKEKTALGWPPRCLNGEKWFLAAIVGIWILEHLWLSPCSEELHPSELIPGHWAAFPHPEAELISEAILLDAPSQAAFTPFLPAGTGRVTSNQKRHNMRDKAQWAQWGMIHSPKPVFKVRKHGGLSVSTLLRVQWISPWRAALNTLLASKASHQYQHWALRLLMGYQSPDFLTQG